MSRVGLAPRSRFREVLRTGRSSSTPNLVFKALPGSDGFRLGVVVTKRLGSAVVRNRMRRRIRGGMAEIGSYVPGRPVLDMVVIARTGCEALDSTELIAQLRRGLEELGR